MVRDPIEALSYCNRMTSAPTGSNSRHDGRGGTACRWQPHLVPPSPSSAMSLFGRCVKPCASTCQERCRCRGRAEWPRRRLQADLHLGDACKALGNTVSGVGRLRWLLRSAMIGGRLNKVRVPSYQKSSTTLVETSQYASPHLGCTEA